MGLYISIGILRIIFNGRKWLTKYYKKGLNQFFEIGDFPYEPGEEEAQEVGEADPDDCIDEGEAVQVDQEDPGQNYVGEISGDFFKKHNAEGEASQTYQTTTPGKGDFVGQEIPARQAEDEGGV